VRGADSGRSDGRGAVVREIKRRTRAVGAFPDRASALRLITAVAMQATSIWRDRMHLDMTLLDHYTTAA
jgi:transposase-like protein